MTLTKSASGAMIMADSTPDRAAITCRAICKGDAIGALIGLAGILTAGIFSTSRCLARVGSQTSVGVQPSREGILFPDRGLLSASS